MLNKINNLFRYTFSKKKVNQNFKFSFRFKDFNAKEIEEILFALDRKYIGYTIQEVQKMTQNTEKLNSPKEIKKTFGSNILSLIGDHPLHKIPLDHQKRLYGIYESFCFYIIAYDPKHKAR
ncbi:MAG: hypothetical protein Q8807_02335 ['Waltheria sp.' little leaf phytoplasma]|nr:hypothetical protein ['Waltheria sp.' little leaf phytoplasma]